MKYWLVKSEPATYSWDEFVKDKKTTWDGIRNYAARNNLRLMQKGDLVLFYHSNEEKEIVGIAKVVKEFYPETASVDADWVVIDIKPVKKLKKRVPLTDIKQKKELSEMTLLKISRLSVQPVTGKEWEIIISMAGEK